MSFWPFSNGLNNNSSLQKFLDSVQDFSTVSVDDLISDPTLSEELLNEFHNIKGNYNDKSTSFQFSSNSEINGNNASNNSDVISLASSNNDTVNVGKDARGVKLLELLLQPHILNGFLDYLVSSVDFFYNQSLKEQEELEKLISGGEDSNEADAANESDIQIEQTEDQTETSTEESHDNKLRRCFQTSSEILSIDLWIISNRIIETPVIMSKLWSILSLPNLKESSPSVSYLIHILDQLMDTNSIELLNFIRRQPDLVDTFLAKIEIPILMDFFLRIIQTDKPDSPTGILETLSSQNLIEKLIDILKPQPSQFLASSKIANEELFFKQTAVTDFIKALVTISSNTALAVVLETNIGPNQLTRELVSPKIINTMINDIMLYRSPEAADNADSITNKHGINNCVGIIIELIRKNNSDYDLNCGSYSFMLGGDNGSGPGTGEINSYVMFQWLKDFEQNPPGPRDPIYLGEMLEIFSDNLSHFSELINLPSKSTPELDAHDRQSYPDRGHLLGFTKFKISELIAELLHCSNMILLNSRKIKKIIKIRDHVRLQQKKRLRNALNESMIFKSSESISSDMSVQDVTIGLDDVSLDDIHFEDHKNEANKEENVEKLLEVLKNQEDSDDEEPTISPENPFVCPQRDEIIRKNSCVGDYFKINLIDSGILLDIISKFTQYPWHNFFHNVVFDLIQQIFNGKLNSYNSFLIVELFKPDKCDLANLIIKSYKNNDVEPRPGYMGHLILISEEVVKFTSLYKPDLISPIIIESVSSEDWEWFVNDVLLKTREIYNVVLGAEPEEDEEEEEHGKSDQDRDYGFDSSTVGYLDLETYDNQNDTSNGDSNTANDGPIILGDKSNHYMFINDRKGLEHDEDDDRMEEVHMPDVQVQNMSPRRLNSPILDGSIDKKSNDRDVGNIKDEDDEDDEDDQYQDTYQDNDFLDNLSGSSSSDEEDDTNSNELRRVSKHES